MLVCTAWWLGDQ